MTSLERFNAAMEYGSADRLPNWELGAWPQTATRWQREGLDASSWTWNWFVGEPALGFDPREFISFNGELRPPFEKQILEEDDETVLVRDGLGRVRRALKVGADGEARMSMDEYVTFPVESPADWQELKKRYDPHDPGRLPPDWRDQLERWATRDHPLIFGRNCALLGFYWKARDWLGTENLSLAWYDEPAMMHDMMETRADFLIGASRPVLTETAVDYICLNEDLAMKTGPLLSPDTYRTFIQPRLRRVIEFFKSCGVRYVAIDTDGNPEVLLPMMMEAGVDIVWPLERAAGQDPLRLRKTFGKSLRLWGGVDKREIAKGKAAIDAHLRSLAPLVEEGGFIPTIDHTVPPDVSWADFQYYLERKDLLLRSAL